MKKVFKKTTAKLPTNETTIGGETDTKHTEAQIKHFEKLFANTNKKKGVKK
jgi:hypothetical protein